MHSGIRQRAGASGPSDAAYTHLDDDENKIHSPQAPVAVSTGLDPLAFHDSQASLMHQQQQQQMFANPIQPGNYGGKQVSYSPANSVDSKPMLSKSSLPYLFNKAGISGMHGAWSWLKNLETLFLIISTILAFVTRFWGLSSPESVCWDETHFGKFANGYIKGEFFFDVHPPLGKIMIAMAGFVTGYRGEFEFKNPGMVYGEVSYMGMRSFCAFFGALTVPFTYQAVIDMGFSPFAAFISALFVVFESGTMTLSRFILLDPLLILFIQSSVFCLARFSTCRNEAFSERWWIWLTATGISLACAFSVKWVGLFIILFAGLTTVKDLWDLLGDLSLSPKILFQHLSARVLCLIIIPAIVYLFFFWVHFLLLFKSGPGDGFMSSRFQTTLIGNELNGLEVPRELAYGSLVSIKNHRSGGALLHSHAHYYPETHPPQQQQITCYSHKDTNNHWIFKRPLNELKVETEKQMAEQDKDPAIPPEFIKHGSIVRLEHVNTKRNLHSHREKAPITTRHFQVTGYGADGVGDFNDHWRIDIVDNPSPNGNMQTLLTKFRLIHTTVGCALHSHSKNLPKWGFEQLEVSCNPNVNDPDNLWNIEYHVNPKLESGVKFDYSPSFLDSVIEIHIAMVQVNNGLKPKENEITSRPWQWPINYKGQRFTGWSETDKRVYLIGNPIIFWGNLVALGVFFIFSAVSAAMAQRGVIEPSWNKERKIKLLACCSWLFIGWCLHYFPFYVMGRVLYFHHYFPALYFSSTITALLLEYFATFLRIQFKSVKLFYSTVAAIIIILSASYLYWSPFGYGMTGPVNSYHPRKWGGDHWEI